MTWVLHLGALGDLVLATPALAWLRQREREREPTRVRGPSPPGEPAFAALTLLAASPQGALLERLGAIDRFVDGSRAGLAPLFGGEAPSALVGHARAGERALCLGAPLPDAAAPLPDPPAGPAAGLRALGLDVTLWPARPAPHVDGHAADHLLAGAHRTLGEPPPAAGAAVPTLAVPDGDRERAVHALRARGLEPSRLIVLHPGSGGREKRWPLERFLGLAERLARRGWCPLVALGPVEQERSPEATDLARARRLPTLDAPDLADLAAAIALARAYVGNDAGPTHLAAALGVPTLALFGPTRPEQWAPRGPGRVAVLQSPESGLGGLSTEAVEAALDDLVDLR